MKDQPTARSRRIDGVLEALEAHPTLFKRLDEIDQVAKRPTQPVELPDDHGVTGAKVVKHPVELGPRTRVIDAT